MRISSKETQRAIWACFWWLNGLLRITHALPHPQPDGHRLVKCGLDICDTDKSPPEFCNPVETRCEACTIRSCEQEICGEWANCTSTAPPRAMTSTRSPVSKIQYDEVTKSDSDTSEMEILQMSVVKLQGRVNTLTYGFYGLAIVILVIVVILVYQLIRARYPPPPRPEGSGHSQYARVDPDETIPMTVHSSADSGIQEAEAGSTHLEASSFKPQRLKRHPQQPVSLGHSTAAMIDEEMGSREATLCVKESHYNGKPTDMAM